MLREFLEKRRVRKIFGKLVAPDKVEAILRGDGLERQPLRPARIEFVLVYVHGDTPEEISGRVGRVAEIAVSHNGVVHNLIGPLVVVAFDTIRTTAPITGARQSLVEHLNRELSSHLKIVHGAADGHYGLIGSGSRMAYSFLLPRFDAMLGTLSRLEFGEIEEFQNFQT